jgi:hypothetical protein
MSLPFVFISTCGSESKVESQRTIQWVLNILSKAADYKWTLKDERGYTYGDPHNGDIFSICSIS